MHIHAVWIGESTPASAAAIARRRDECGDAVMLHTGPDLLPQSWLSAYERYCVLPQMKADLVRLAALRAYGGLYLDLDVTLRATAGAVVDAMGCDTLSVVCLQPLPFIGGDIIYCPADYEGWSLIDSYVAEFSDTPTRYVFVRFTHMLFAHLTRHQAIHVACNRALFPYRREDLRPESLVCRGFECQPSPGLGDLVASGLAAVGITKERVQAVASKVGVKDCGCKKRQAALNRIGTKLGLPPGQT